MEKTIGHLIVLVIYMALIIRAVIGNRKEK